MNASEDCCLNLLLVVGPSGVGKVNFQIKSGNIN